MLLKSILLSHLIKGTTCTVEINTHFLTLEFQDALHVHSANEKKWSLWVANSTPVAAEGEGENREVISITTRKNTQVR